MNSPTGKSTLQKDAALRSGHSGSLGKYSTGLMSRAIGGKMPGGFNI